MPSDPSLSFRILGRYAVSEKIGAGGMATVHLGRLLGGAGFSRTVAVKQLHPHLAENEGLVAMFLDEARLASRIRHPNVVPTLDVGTEGEDIFLVMEYVLGESLDRLFFVVAQHKRRVACRVLSSIMIDALQGLHAAHEAKSEQGIPLDLVHRDVSPHNILVGADGIARVVDFGVAKAAVRAHVTRDGSIKGKLAYMAPEHLRGSQVDRRADLYSAGVLLWEALTGKRLFTGETEGELLTRVLGPRVEAPSSHGPFEDAMGEQTAKLDEVVLRALDKDPNRRFATAQEMATALEDAMPPASKREVAEWVAELVGPKIAARSERMAAFERAAIDVEPTLTMNAPARPPSDRPAPLMPTSSPVVLPTKAPSRGRPIAIAAAAGLVLVATFAAGTYVRSKRVPPTVAVAPNAPARSAPAPTVEMDASVPSVIATPVASSLPAVPTSGPRRVRIRPKDGGAAQPAPDCDPPYTRGPDGVILHKPECIGVP